MKGVEWAPFSFHSRSVLRISAEEGGNFTCQAMNQLSSETAMDQKSFMVYVDKPNKESGSDNPTQVFIIFKESFVLKVPMHPY